MYNKLTTHCPYVTLCCVSQRHNKLVDQQLYGCTGGPGFKSQSRRCRVTVLCKTVHTHCASVHQAAKLVAALLRTAGVTAGLAESTGSLPPGLWLTSLPRTGTTSGTLRSVIEYWLPFLPVLLTKACHLNKPGKNKVMASKVRYYIHNNLHTFLQPSAKFCTKL